MPNVPGMQIDQDSHLASGPRKKDKPLPIDVLCYDYFLFDSIVMPSNQELITIRDLLLFRCKVDLC